VEEQIARTAGHASKKQWSARMCRCPLLRDTRVRFLLTALCGRARSGTTGQVGSSDHESNPSQISGQGSCRRCPWPPDASPSAGRVSPSRYLHARASRPGLLSSSPEKAFAFSGMVHSLVFFSFCLCLDKWIVLPAVTCAPLFLWQAVGDGRNSPARQAGADA
jgi:hypothetical protein